MAIGTPSSDSEQIRDVIAQRERQMQTAFPVKVVDYDPETSTCELEPQFIEAWRDGSVRVNETFALESDAHIINVPVAFPRAGNYRITFPLVAGDFGLVICTKFSLDVWRETATAGDPGDLRRFSMAGAVFHPVNLYPNDDPIDATTDPDHASVISLSAGGTTDFVALAAKVKSDLDNIKTEFTTIKTAIEAISCSTGAITAAYTVGYTATDPKASKVKAE